MSLILTLTRGEQTTFSGIEKYLLAKDRSRIYQHILLNGNPVMSKTDITRKLSNTYTLHGLRDKAIQNLVTDKLLIVGDWFASRNSNGTITLHQGYLKGHPEENPEDKSRFCRILSQYGIDHESYHYSFNNGKPFTKSNDQWLRRRLSSENISSKSWCFSNLLVQHISKSSYLQSRLELDKDAVIYEKVDSLQTSSHQGSLLNSIVLIANTKCLYLDIDRFQQVARQNKGKKKSNQVVHAKKLVDEVENLIHHLPPVRKRIPKSFH